MNWISHNLWSILAYAAVFTLSIIPVPEVPELERVPIFDKWVHFVMYGAICCCVWLDHYRHCGTSRRVGLTVWAKTVIFPILFGGIMELWQAYLTTCRSGDWYDLLADSIGVFLSLPVGLFFIRPWAYRRANRRI